MSDNQKLTYLSIALENFCYSWNLRARVFAKWPTRTYTGRYKNGRVFSFDICDESSEIRLTAYDEQCTALEPRIIVGQVYRITHGDVVLANPKYNFLKNAFQVNVGKRTTIEAITQGPLDLVPLIHFQLNKISSLKTVGIYTGSCDSYLY